MILALAAFPVLCAAVALILRALEPSLLFHPRTARQQWFPLAPDFQELVLPGGTSALWCSLPQAEFVVLYCHGNFGNISMREEWTRVLQLHLNASVLLFDYPGFGKTPGRPTEAGCYQTAQSAFDWLLEHGHKPEHIILWGKSLGAAMAVELARRQPKCRALVLLDPFSNVPDAANVLLHLPLGWLARNRFDNLAKIGDIEMMKIIIGGELDTLCPSWMAQRLGEAAREPKAVQILRGRNHAEALPETEWKWIASCLRQTERP